MSRTLEGIEIGDTSIEGLELLLEPGARILGTVTGLEVDELAQLRLRVSGPPGPPPSRPGRTPDYQGRFVIEDLAPGDWRVAASWRGTEVAEKVTIEPGMREVEVRLELEGGSSLSGFVLEGGEPAPELTVRLAGPTSAWGQTDWLGRFELERLEPGSYELSVRRGLLPLHHEPLELAGDLELTIELPDARLAGRVIDAEESFALAGARLSLQPAERSGAASGAGYPMTADGEGRFAYQDISRGDYRLEVSRAGYATRSIAITVDGPPGPDELEVTLDRARGLTLLVRGPDGRPARQVTITLLALDGQEIATRGFSAGENGRIEIPDLGDGWWRLELSTRHALGELEVSLPAPRGAEPQRVELEWGGEVELALPELLDARDPRYRVDLIDAAGRQARLWATGGSRLYSGPLRLGPLRPGPWHIEVELPGGAVLATKVTVTPRALVGVTLP